MKHYQTLGCYFYSELLPFIGWGRGHRKLITPHHGTITVKMEGSRLECFRRSPKCSNCGIIGEIFLLQLPKRPRLGERPHLNLYAFQGEALVMMTKDHIIPCCLGERRSDRKEDLVNLQPMCYYCNRNKGSLLPRWIGGGSL
jgi:5-methylcytosine-specific restriction endonuclease McrA